ncbi:hypothetical protein E2562_037630 [Oryza meyeriana var. granulata]|uniref:Uncharacterized protein n=1 Tax=Oryza meyeriana var. granulata TaxID=110450 RepID=A0A6G1CXC1_9ORYZ|nr:hypothetical protein E2562_037630 [Oryza meyeriana var. granulata]
MTSAAAVAPEVEVVVAAVAPEVDDMAGIIGPRRAVAEGEAEEVKAAPVEVNGSGSNGSAWLRCGQGTTTALAVESL